MAGPGGILPVAPSPAGTPSVAGSEAYRGAVDGGQLLASGPARKRGRPRTRPMADLPLPPPLPYPQSQRIGGGGPTYFAPPEADESGAAGRPAKRPRYGYASSGGGEQGSGGQDGAGLMALARQQLEASTDQMNAVQKLTKALMNGIRKVIPQLQDGQQPQLPAPPPPPAGSGWDSRAWNLLSGLGGLLGLAAVSYLRARLVQAPSLSSPSESGASPAPSPGPVPLGTRSTHL